MDFKVAHPIEILVTWPSVIVQINLARNTRIIYKVAEQLHVGHASETSTRGTPSSASRSSTSWRRSCQSSRGPGLVVVIGVSSVSFVTSSGSLVSSSDVFPSDRSPCLLCDLRMCLNMRLLRQGIIQHPDPNLMCSIPGFGGNNGNSSSSWCSIWSIRRRRRVWRRAWRWVELVVLLFCSSLVLFSWSLLFSVWWHVSASIAVKSRRSLCSIGGGTIGRPGVGHP